jgi:hypothetical protein
MALLVTQTSCSRDIGEIVSDPDRFTGKTVSVKGDVIDTYAIWDTGFYQLEDPTGSIWVFSKNVPAEGARGTVKGTMKTGIRVGSMSAGPVLSETSRSF